jgi:hypothetical protein
MPFRPTAKTGFRLGIMQGRLGIVTNPRDRPWELHFLDIMISDAKDTAGDIEVRLVNHAEVAEQIREKVARAVRVRTEAEGRGPTARLRKFREQSLVKPSWPSRSIRTKKQR